MRSGKFTVATNSPVDFWNNGDGTVSLIVNDSDGKQVELVFGSSSVLGRLSRSADEGRSYLKLAKRPPQIYGG